MPFKFHLVRWQTSFGELSHVVRLPSETLGRETEFDHLVPVFGTSYSNFVPREIQRFYDILRKGPFLTARLVCALVLDGSATMYLSEQLSSNC